MFVYVHTPWFRMLLIRSSKYSVTLWIAHVTGDDICFPKAVPEFQYVSFQKAEERINSQRPYSALVTFPGTHRKAQGAQVQKN